MSPNPAIRPLQKFCTNSYSFLGLFFHLFKKISLSTGLGYGSQVVVLYTGVYYIIILAWTFLYLFSSFSSELPWASCHNSWNTGTETLASSSSMTHKCVQCVHLADQYSQPLSFKMAASLTIKHLPCSCMETAHLQL